MEQPAIALPDSGGLVLPLAHSGFLVGLLTVERCPTAPGGHAATADPQQQQQQPEAGGSIAAPTSSVSSGSSGGGGGASSPQPRPSAHPSPACALFGPRELSLLRTAAAVLAAACAMELRTVLERVAVSSLVLRQAAARELVAEARAPLSTLRTLGTMLRGRLPQVRLCECMYACVCMVEGWGWVGRGWGRVLRSGDGASRGPEVGGCSAWSARCCAYRACPYSACAFSACPYSAWR